MDKKIARGRSRISHRGHGAILGGHGPPMRALFGENVCENERIGCRGGGACAGKFYVNPPVITHWNNRISQLFETSSWS